MLVGILSNSEWRKFQRNEEYFRDTMACGISFKISNWWVGKDEELFQRKQWYLNATKICVKEWSYIK